MKSGTPPVLVATIAARVSSSAGGRVSVTASNCWITGVESGSTASTEIRSLATRDPSRLLASPASPRIVATIKSGPTSVCSRVSTRAKLLRSASPRSSRINTSGRRGSQSVAISRSIASSIRL